MQLLLSTWTEVEDYLQSSVGLIIPIGSTEQHGPTGLIGTDALTAEAIARGVGEQTGALVGPTINLGMALHHTGFPGTISLRPSTLLLVVRDYLGCLAKAGFQRFFFINGHGGNIATLKAAFAETYSDLADRQIPGAAAVRCRLANWFMQRAVMAMAHELYGSEEGSHATPSEVAVTQFLYPDSIKGTPLTQQPGQGHDIYGPADFRQRYPDGRMGSNPALATPEHGKRFYDAAVAALAQEYQAFLNEA